MALAIDQSYGHESGDDTYVMLVTGAGNVSELEFPLTSLGGLRAIALGQPLHGKATGWLHKPLQEAAGAVGDLIVPKNYGIGPPGWSYDRLEGDIDAAVKAGGNRPKKAVAASLGGLLMTYYSATHPEEDIEVLALCSPFEGTWWLGVFSGMFREMSEEIAELRDDLGEYAPGLIEVGSDGDYFVNKSSALPDLPGARRLLLTRNIDAAAANNYTPIVVPHPPNHFKAHRHPAVISIAQDMVRGTEVALQPLP